MRRLLGFVAALALVATGSLAVASAQEGTPTLTLESTLPATLQDTDGLTVAVALLAEGDDGEVRVGVLAMGLTSGEHGMHVHETGVCDPTGDPAFASAGGHYNPTDEEHGDHAGDLGNITIEDDGTGTFEDTTDNFDLDELMDEDGSSIVIHAEEDENDPEGESYGARIACGVLAAPVETAAPTAVAVPTATVAATAPATDDGTVTIDADGDGLADEEELAIGTDPNNADSDTDRLSDGFEVREFGTNPLADDSDEDGLGDGDELEVYGTDPLAVDTDGDGVDDATEIDAGTDPTDPASS